MATEHLAGSQLELDLSMELYRRIKLAMRDIFEIAEVGGMSNLAIVRMYISVCCEISVECLKICRVPKDIALDMIRKGWDYE